MISTRLSSTLSILSLILCFCKQTGKLTAAEATAASAAFIGPQCPAAPLSSVRHYPHQQRQRQHAHWRPPTRQPRPSRQQSLQVTMGDILRPGVASAGVGSLLPRGARRLFRPTRAAAADSAGQGVGNTSRSVKRRSRKGPNAGTGMGGRTGGSKVDGTAPAEIRRAAPMRDQIWAMLRPDFCRVRRCLVKGNSMHCCCRPAQGCSFGLQLSKARTVVLDTFCVFDPAFMDL